MIYIIMGVYDKDRSPIPVYEDYLSLSDPNFIDRILILDRNNIPYEIIQGERVTDNIKIEHKVVYIPKENENAN